MNPIFLRKQFEAFNHVEKTNSVIICEKRKKLWIVEKKTLGGLDKSLKSHHVGKVWKVWKLMIEMRKEKRGEIPLLPSSGRVSIHHQVLSKFRNPIKTNLDIFLYLISPIYHRSITDINWNMWNKNLFSQVTGSRMKCERFFIEGFYLFALFCLVFAFFVSPSLFNSFSLARKGRSVLSQWRLRIGGRSCSTQCRQCPSYLCSQFLLNTFPDGFTF